MSYDLPTGDEAIRELRRELEILRESVPVNTFFLGQEQGHTALGGLSDIGGKTGGITSYHPQTETLGKEDLADDELEVSSTTIIVDGTGNSLDLKNIVGTQADGQIVTIKPKEGKTLTLKTGGNIDVSSDTQLTDTQFTILQFFEDATATGTAGKYMLLSSSGAGGLDESATPTWTGDHIFQEDVTIGTGTDDLLTIKSAIKGHTVDISDVGNTADTVFWDANLDMNTWNIYDLDSLYFSVGSSSTSPSHNTNSYSIDAVDSGSNESLNFYTKSGKDFKWFDNGSEVMRYDGGSDEWRMSKPLDMNTNKIENVGDPTGNNDVVNKQYADANYGGGGSDSDDHTWTGVHKFQNSLTELGNGGSDVIKMIGEVQGGSAATITNPDGSGNANYPLPNSGTTLSLKTNLMMNTYNIYDLDQLIFGHALSTLTPAWENDHIGLEVEQDTNYDTYALAYNVPSGNEHWFQVGSGSTMDRVLTIGKAGSTNYLFMGRSSSKILLQDTSSISGNSSSDFIGFHCSDSTGAGTLGQMEIPYYYDQWGSDTPSSSIFNTRFGTTSGSIGIYERNADIRLVARNRYGGWSYKKIDNT